MVDRLPRLLERLERGYMNKPKLTVNERASIEELKALARKWPRSLLLGADTDDDRKFSVWKRSETGGHYAVDTIPRLRNMDAW